MKYRPAVSQIMHDGATLYALDRNGRIWWYSGASGWHWLVELPEVDLDERTGDSTYPAPEQK